jgi:hypothetical protein
MLGSARWLLVSPSHLEGLKELWLLENPFGEKGAHELLKPVADIILILLS